MSTSFKLKPLALAMLPVLFAGHTYAAENTADEAANETETIEVTGYRGSILKSIHDKRNASGVVDSIFAEDIGKTTDQNIADALSRVTGVSIQQTDGEGTKISVRGAPSDLNNISLNGVQLTSSDANQSVDLSAFSADILSQISVYKTSSADHDEGALGANVILRTTKPLNIQKDIMSFEVQGRYNDFAEKYDRKLSGTISKKFFDETFGVIVTVADETQAIRKDQVTGNWQNPYEVVDIKAGGARDLDGNIIENSQKAIIQKTLGHNLYQNQRDRFTVNAGFQFIPTDSTDIQLDLSYSKQNVINDNHSVGVNTPDFIQNEDKFNLTTGKYGNVQIPGTNIDVISPDTGMPIPRPSVDDPQQDWWVLNTDTNTIVKSLNRFGSGNFSRTQSEDETINQIATLNINQEITDSLRLEIKAGYSHTKLDDLKNQQINTANWNTLPRDVLIDIPVEDLQPVGYDCTSGACQLVVGSGKVTNVLGGVNGNQRNKSTTSFNPLDPYAHHLANAVLNDRFTRDTNKSLFVDFDWDVDTLGVNLVEFGVKISKRTKDFYSSTGRFEGAAITAFDSEGNVIKGNSASDILVSEIRSDDVFPYSNWMDGLASQSDEYSNDFYKQGFILVDTDKALENMFSVEDINIRYDTSARRKTIQDNYSAYGKVNFEYLGGKLTGDLGVRFVHTEVESPIGNSAINYFKGDRIFTPHELVQNGLFDNTNSACSPSTGANRIIRIDGEYVLKSGAELDALYNQTNNVDQTFTNAAGKVFNVGDTVDNEYPCYDPAMAESTYVNANGETVTGTVGLDTTVINGRSWWGNIRHADNTTVGDNYQRLYTSSGAGESDVWLPSLNLNYQVNEEIITRFAMSKTMSRPGFDLLRPGFTVNENPWGQFGSLNAPNPNLQPLKSSNLDLSFEWYFNQTGQLSLAMFYKDMVDFTETVKENYYIRDMRRDDRDTLNLDELLIPIDESYRAGDSILLGNGESVECMPDRLVQDNLKGTANLGCEIFQASVVRNGAGVTTKGLEFAYRQTYDFLPGVLSGLGLDFNYTWANSETEAEVSELTGKVLKALPQAYTPEHTTNTAIYWQDKGHSLKLTHRYSSIQLADRGLVDGASWLDARSTVDFSASYKLNSIVSFTFNALNLTNEEYRTFFTSSSMDLGEVDSEGNKVLYDEGNPMDDSSVTTSRTIVNYKTGRQYRLGLRVKF